MGKNVEAWKEKAQLVTTEKEKFKLKNHGWQERKLIGEAKANHKVNVAYFRRLFCERTPMTIMGLTFVGLIRTETNELEDKTWLGKFQYKSKTSGSIITEKIPLTEKWVRQNIQKPYVDRIKKATLECDESEDHFVKVPPKCVNIDQRKVIQARYVPERTVNGKLLTTETEAIKRKIATNYLYRRIFEKKKIKEHYLVKLNDQSI